jgi:hypothetical protein
MITFLTKTFIKRTEPGQRQSITHEGYVVHCYVRSDGLAGRSQQMVNIPPASPLSCWVNFWMISQRRLVIHGKRARQQKA